MARFSMLDIALIHRDPDRVRQSLAHRGQDPSVVDDVLRYDAEYRSALTAAERAKAEKNRLSASIGRAQDKAAAARELRPQVEALSQEIASAEESARALSIDDPSPLRAALELIPNLLDDSVPPGSHETSNVELRRWGTPRTFEFEPKPHWEIGENLGIIDFARAAKLSGSRFAVLSGAGARLSRGLAAFFLERANERGYLEIAPPLLVSRATMWSTGQLSKFADAMFEDSSTQLFMIPTRMIKETKQKKNANER